MSKKPWKLLTQQEELDRLMDNEFEKVVLVDLFCSWAGPCTEIREFYMTLFNTMEGADQKIEIVQVEQHKLAFPEGIAIAEVHSRPRFLIFYHGKLKETIEGANSHKIKDGLIKHIPVKD